MLRRQRFSQKFSSTDRAICRSDVSPQRVAGTCRLVCSDLKLMKNNLRKIVLNKLYTLKAYIKAEGDKQAPTLSSHNIRYGRNRGIQGTKAPHHYYE